MKSAIRIVLYIMQDLDTKMVLGVYVAMKHQVRLYNKQIGSELAYRIYARLKDNSATLKSIKILLKK